MRESPFSHGAAEGPLEDLLQVVGRAEAALSDNGFNRIRCLGEELLHGVEALALNVREDG